MINEMDWTPESFPESEGEVASKSFVEAIARFNLRAEINAARQRNAEAPSTCTLECSTSGAVGSGDTHESPEAAVDPWVDTVDEDMAQMKIVESATERIKPGHPPPKLPSIPSLALVLFSLVVRDPWVPTTRSF